MLLTYTMPHTITRSTYLLLSEPDSKISSEILIEDLLQYVSSSERRLIRKAQDRFDSLESFETDLLGEFFIANNFFELPKKETFNEQLLVIAENKLCTKPLPFIKKIKEGIPIVCEPFWNSLTIDRLNYIFDSQGATADKVLSVITTEKEDLNTVETTTLYYLKTFIRSLNKEELRKFLFFVTASSNMPEKITVTFIKLFGISRRPIVHTCSNVIELSTNYLDYYDFASELKSVLSSESAFEYNQI